ncbi:hypothetical protein GRI39_03505 [Altererythrobacter indicus]|uniref:Phage holin family protein n=1 Tax=Altericroceibacterium indicum TaxID=374177 RepID=A0A845A773_9SPHN|nr:phage holin family protein [Altericroceibacterium indicum]MXP25113.1 hypothetical protein [Altericroceibacterium indicum]
MTLATDDKNGPAGTDKSSHQAPPPYENMAGDRLDGSDPEADTHPIRDDLTALIDDGLTFLEAELNFQKTRLSFVVDCIKKTAIFGVAAIFLAILAAIGLTIGLIMCLTPYITAWGATAVVVGGLLALAYYCVTHVVAKIKAISAAFKKDEDLPE